jgi:dTDP-4-dehydrorhamnose 3,5-epimerase
LSEKNKKQLWVPPGLAHGFVVVSEIADLEYKCTDYYDPADEACLAWDDPALNIHWPIDEPILSDNDQNGLSLGEVQ